MLGEIRVEAGRLDRSLSWVVQRAWKVARHELRKFPGTNEMPDDSPDDAAGADE